MKITPMAALLGSAAMIGAAGPLWAQATPYELEAIVLYSDQAAPQATTRLSRDPKTAPRASSSITTETAKQQGAESVEEAVAYTPSATTEAFGLDDRYDTIALRGFSVQTDGMYRDGLRQRSLGFAGPRTEPYSIESLDVVRGPTADLFGANGPGGLVNTRSKRPEFETARETYIKIDNHGSTQLGFDVTGQLSETLAGRAIVVAGSEETRYDEGDGSRLHFSPSLTWTPSDATKLTVYGQWQKDQVADSFVSVPRSGTQLPGSFKAKPDLYTKDPNRNDIDAQQNFIGYEFEHQGDKGKVYSRARYSTSDLDSATAFPVIFVNSSYLLGQPTGGFSDIDAALLGDFDVHHRAKEISFDLGYTGNGAIGATDLTFAYGVDFYRSQLKGDRATTVRNIKFLKSGVVVPTGRPAIGRSQKVDRQFQQTGVYLTGRGQNGPLIVDFGLRHDWIKSDLDLQTAILGTPSRTVSKVERTFTSANLGTSYQINDQYLVYGSLSRSFAPAPLGVTRDGKALKLEESDAFELGLRFDNGTANFGIAAFQIEKKNASFSVDGGTLSNSVFEQAGKIRSRGIELEGMYRWDNGLSIMGNLTYTDAKFVADPRRAGQDLPRIPRQQGAVWLTYDMPTSNGDWTFGIGGRFVGERYTGTDNSITMDSYSVIDASVNWSRGDLDVTFAARNLGDKAYLAHCGDPSLPAGVGFDAFIPAGGVCNYGPGREMSLTVSTRF